MIVDKNLEMHIYSQQSFMIITGSLGGACQVVTLVGSATSGFSLSVLECYFSIVTQFVNSFYPKEPFQKCLPVPNRICLSMDFIFWSRRCVILF